MGIPTLVIGVKNRGATWAEALRGHPRFRLEGLADIDREVLEARGEELGVPEPARFTDHRAALASGRFRAAVVVVPNHLHFPIARDVLEAGAHCLLEKPFAETMEQAEGLVELAAARGLALVIGQNYRFKPQFRAAAEALRSGRLGRLIGVEASFHRHRPPRAGHELGWRYPLLSIQGVHHLDWLLSVLPAAVTGIHCRHRLPPGSPWRSPSVCHLVLACADGTLVSWRGSYECRGGQTPYNGLWRLECSGGDVRIDGEGRVWQEDAAGRRCLYEPAAGDSQRRRPAAGHLPRGDRKRSGGADQRPRQPGHPAAALRGDPRRGSGGVGRGAARERAAAPRARHLSRPRGLTAAAGAPMLGPPMILLALSTLFSAGFALCMRFAQKRKADLTVVGAVNYLTAALFHPVLAAAEGWRPAAAAGVLIGVGGGLAYASAFFVMNAFMLRRGVSVTGAVTRLSVLIPVGVSLLAWGERAGGLQAAGGILAVLSLPLLSLRPREAAAGLEGAGGPRRARAAADAPGGTASRAEGRGAAGRPVRAERRVPARPARLPADRHPGGGRPVPAGHLRHRRLHGLRGVAAAGARGAPRGLPGAVLASVLPGVAVGLCNALANRFIIAALKRLPSLVVYPFYSAVGLLVTVAFSRLVWKERIGRLEAVGMALALVSIVLINLD